MQNINIKNSQDAIKAYSDSANAYSGTKMKTASVDQLDAFEKVGQVQYAGILRSTRMRRRSWIILMSTARTCRRRRSRNKGRRQTVRNRHVQMHGRLRVPLLPRR